MKKLQWLLEKCIIVPIFLSIFILVSFYFVSCKKDLNETRLNVAAKAPVPPYPFNWETSDFMPTPSGTVILVPWANGSVKGFSSEIWYDYKSSDGWQLVYNVFNNQSLPPNPWFVLYNKYRGIVRIYVYVTNSGFVTSTYLTSGLQLSPNSLGSNMLNYVGRDVIDVNSNSNIVTQIEPAQMATGTWYASQYEVAYDNRIPNTTIQQLGLNWSLKWTDVSQVSLQGDIQGSLNGVITAPQNKFNIGQILNQGALSGLGLAIISNNKGPDGARPGYQNHLGLPEKIFDAFSSGLTSTFSGVVKNILSGVFGGDSNKPNNEQVSLTLNAKITLNGTITNNGALIPDPGLGLGVPGLSNSQIATGYIPGYDKPMGVFYISAKPKVKATRSTWNYITLPGVGGVPGTGPRIYGYDYRLEENSFQMQFNPEVTSNASIQTVSYELLMIPGNMYESLKTSGLAKINQPFVNETIGDYSLYKFFGPANYVDSYTNSGSSYAPRFIIRISFDVVPNNGAPKSKIIKSFWAEIIY